MLSPNPPFAFSLRYSNNNKEMTALLYQDSAGKHRTEQQGPLYIINSPLVVLSTGPMHILKKHPVNMLCIGLVRRLDKKNQHPRN